MASVAVFTDCRFCLEKKRHVLPINDEMSSVYFAVTQMKLAHLHSYSNAVCLLCYKKLLSAQSYREMLIQIEQKLLSTFNHTQPKNLLHQQLINTSGSNNKAIRSNGAPSTPIVKNPSNKIQPATTSTVRRFAQQQISKHTAQTAMDEDEDMSLLEEIVSIDAPNVSDFFNENDQSNLYTNLLSEEDTKAGMEDFDDNSLNFKVKEEPEDETPISVNETSSNNKYMKSYPEKPYKCNIAGCRQSSTTPSALQKHRRRVHGIRMRQSVLGGKITRAKPSQLYNDLDLSSNVFKCKFCHLDLRNRRVLLRHIETVHMQAKFYCTVPGCNHASTRKDNYRLHLKNYHRDLPDIEMERVLNETKNMKPVYATSLPDLKIKRDEQQEKYQNDDDNDEEEEEEDDLSHHSKNGETSGFSFINITGGVEDVELL